MTKKTIVADIREQLRNIQTTGLTYQDIAELSGLNISTVWRAINEKNDIPLKTIEKLYDCGLLKNPGHETQLDEAFEIAAQCQHWNSLAKEYVTKYKEEGL